MFTGMELMACENLAVSAEVMQHVVHVESSANPYAIGVVGGRLVRQPKNLGEALATVRMLDAGKYNYSLGLTQVNRANLQKYGLDSYEKAFMPCANVAAGARILADCYADSGSDWGKAFSCYYSGNFVAGFRDGYVRKIYHSIRHGAAADTGTGDADVPAKHAESSSPTAGGKAEPLRPGSPAYRVAIRSVAFDMAATTVLSDRASAPHNAKQRASPLAAAAATPGDAITWAATHEPGVSVAESANPAAMALFVPQVRGPNDPSPANASAGSARVLSAPAPNAGPADRAGAHEEHGDAAFVF